jgi:hypothetical protein
VLLVHFGPSAAIAHLGPTNWLLILKLEGQKFVVRMRIWRFMVIVLTRTTPTKGSVRDELKGDLLLASKSEE